MKIQKHIITKPLSVRLTDEEVLKYGREAARAVADRESIESDFDSMKKDYKARIDEQTAIVSKLSPRIHSGKETRDVECEEVKDWTKGTVVVTRLDTFEIVDQRPMRDEERQMEVQLEEEADVQPADDNTVAFTLVTSVKPEELSEETTDDDESNPFA
jgi:hypothetical protein